MLPVMAEGRGQRAHWPSGGARGCGGGGRLGCRCCSAKPCAGADMPRLTAREASGERARLRTSRRAAGSGHGLARCVSGPRAWRVACQGRGQMARCCQGRWLGALRVMADGRGRMADGRWQMTDATLLSGQMAEGRGHVAREAERVGAAAKGVWVVGAAARSRAEGPTVSARWMMADGGGQMADG